MRSTRIGRKILAGILCAAMVFQCVPAEAMANEIAETVQSYDQEVLDRTEPQEESTKTSVDVVSSEDAQVITEADTEEAPEVDEKLDAPESSELAENINTADMSSTSEEADTLETLSMTDEMSMTEEMSTTEGMSTTEEPSTLETSTTEESSTLETTTMEGSEALETSEISETLDVEETEDIIEVIETLEMDTDSSETETASTEEETTEPEITPLPDYKKLLYVESELTYYYYENAKDIFVKLKGCEIPEDRVRVDFYIDETLFEAIKDEDDYYRISLQDKNISIGSHTLTVKLIDSLTSEPVNELVSKKFEFRTEAANIFLEADKYYISTTEDTIEVTLYNPEEDNIKSVQITAPNGDIVARSEQISSEVPQNEDPRYSGIGNGYKYEGNILYKTTWVLPIEKNALEIGNYDIRLILKDNSDMLLGNVIEVSSKAVVTKCVLGTDYDNTSGFVYLYIQGSGFDPLDIQFDFKDKITSAPLSTQRIDYKTVQSGYIVKFRKEGGWEKAGKEIIVTISKKSGNIDFTQTKFEALLESGIYYAEYNNVLNAVEVGVTVDLNGKAVKFSIVESEDATEELEVTRKGLTESIEYLTPKGALKEGKYFVRLKETGGVTYHKEFTVSQKATVTEYWDAPTVISKNAERHDFYYYDTEAGISNDTLKASIDGYSGEVAVYASEWHREDGAKGTRIQVWIPTQKLSLGSHTVRIIRDGKSYTSHTFEVIASNYGKFVLDTYALSWIDDNTIQVYIKTPNCAESDDFDIKLTEINGGEVTGISTVVTERYTDSVFMNITGLDRNKAFKDYYVLITHKELGQPYKMSNLNEKYYTDTEVNGERKSISSNKGLPVLANNRVIGINIQNLALPATLTIYATENTDVIDRITIPSTTEGNFYYFTKEFYDSLEKKDRLYDMTVTDYGENWGRSYARINLGYKEEETVNDFDLQIITDTLYVDGAESGKSTVITVSGNKQKPVFEVSNDDIVELEDYIETSEVTGVQTTDPNKRRVIAKTTGTTFITVIADGVKKSVFVTVTRNTSGITINTSDRHMKVGDSFEAEAFIQPSSADDPTQIISFTSSDNNILYVKKLTDRTARVTALKAGTAMLRATLKGTPYTVAVTISITDSFPLYDKKEIKIKEVGTVSYIENVDRALSYCKLPKGWEWDNGDLILTASDELQYCWATYTEDGYQPFSARLPVAATRIVGIDITGKKLINQGQKETYQITYQCIGADINTSKFKERLTTNCVRTSEENIAAVETLEWDNLVIAAMDKTSGGTANFSLTLAIDQGTSQGADLFVKDFSVEVPLTDCVNNVKVKPVKLGNEKFTYVETQDRMEVDQKDVRDAKNKYSIKLEAEATINGKLAPNIKFDWESSDTAVATVAVNDNNEVILTVKKEGNVDITAKAQDQGECTGTLTVNIMDYAPVLEVSNITVNKYCTQGTEFVLQEQNGNRITSVNVLEKDGKEDRNSSNFSASAPIEGISTLRIKPNAPVLSNSSKKVSDCKLEVVTEKGKYPYSLKVTTDVTKPSATLKLKTKANLFYKDAEAVYTISSKYDIQSIEIPEVDGIGFNGSYHRSNNTVTFHAKGLDSNTVGQFSSKSPTVKVQLIITFADYTQPQTIELKVATENKKPSLSLTGMVVCPGITSGVVNVINSKTKEQVPLDNTMAFAVTKPLNSGMSTALNRDGSIKVDYLGTKNVSYTAELSSPDWTQSASAKGKITYVTSPDKLALSLGSKQLTLNMATNITANGTNTIPISVNGSDIGITKLTYGGSAAKLIDTDGYLACDIRPSSQGIRSISLGLNAGKRGTVKAGTYKLDLFATVNLLQQEIVIKKATLTIKLTEPDKAKVTLASPKGKINLIDRENTSVVYTPKVSGIDSVVRSVSVVGENAEYFTASLNADNKVEVKLKTGKGMSSRQSYPLTIQSVLQNGYKILSSVKIKPVNTLPKIVFTPAKCNLYRSNSNKYTVSVSLKNSNIDIDNITGIKIDPSNKNNANNFLLINNISKNGTVSFNLAGNRTKIKKGQYKVKCLVSFRDADPEAKPATVNMTITVK
ncbi:MAG: hypothetical protein K1W37_09040 [Lachnospiraceae bacterium]